MRAFLPVTILPRISLMLGWAAMLISSLTHAATFVVDDAQDAIDANPGDGLCEIVLIPPQTEITCTLRAAIQEANASSGADEVTLPEGVYELTLEGAQENNAASGDIDILDNVVIRGAGPNSTILDGMQKDRLFEINDTSGSDALEVSVSGITIMNGLIEDLEGAGGGIWSNANLTLSNVLLHHNGVTGTQANGGALCNVGGRVELNAVTFSNNSAKNYGGAACNLADGVMVMTDTTFETNTTVVDGVLVHRGGALLSAGTLTATNSRFIDNYSVFGGAIFLEHGSATFTDVEVATNASWLHGGAVHVGSHDEHGAGIPVEFIVKNSTFRKNEIRGGNGRDGDPQGGALFITGGSQVTIEDSEIIDNDAKGECAVCLVNGGGISVGDGDVTLNRVRIAGNKAAQWGGGIYVANNKDIQDPANPLQHIVNRVNLTEVEITGNKSLDSGGGIAAEYAHDADTLQFLATVTLDKSLVAENSSFNGGGLVGSVVATNSTFSSNEATGNTVSCGTDPSDRDLYCGRGGAIFVPHKNNVLSLTHVTLFDNTSTARSGGTDIYNVVGAPVSVKQSILASGSGGTNCVGPLVSENYNVVSDGSCDLSNSSDLQDVDPLLSTLSANGVTTGLNTHALEAASPARDIIPLADCLPNDQRGYVRGPEVCDAGAFESDAGALAPAPTPVASGGDSGGGGGGDPWPILLIIPFLMARRWQ